MPQRDDPGVHSGLLLRVSAEEQRFLSMGSQRLGAWAQDADEGTLWMLKVPDWADPGLVEFLLVGVLSMEPPPVSAVDLLARLDRPAADGGGR